MDKVKILVPIGCRSDEGLSAPIIKRLKEQDWCKCNSFQLYPVDFNKSYNVVDSLLKIKPIDLILITGDRIEMTAAACAAFHNNVKIAHVYAGVVNNPITTFDDINRHVITLWSDIQFVESIEAHSKVCLLKSNIILNPEKNCHIVGITHLDDLEIDESLVPNEPYDVVLLNPTMKGGILFPGLTDIKEINWIKKERLEIWIGSNPDSSIKSVPKGSFFYDNLPRPQFFGLLKNCERFITNSSAAYYEAPYFLKLEQIILIGNRNKNRSTPKTLEMGASDKIVRILKEYFENNKNK